MIKNTKIKSENRMIKCGQETFEYCLIRKARLKNVYLRIKSDGSISISADKRVSIGYIEDFFRSKQEYIVKALARYERLRESKEKPCEYMEGDGIRYLGRRLTLRLIVGNAEGVEADNENIYLTTKDTNDFARKNRIFCKWLKAMQTELYEQICRKTFPLFIKYGVEYPEIKIRKTTSIWGSCQPQKRIITLSSKLIAESYECIEYVVLHEFAHFVEPNHSKHFYALIAEYMPDWKKRKEQLRYGG